ncbi:isocitrate lyase/PEP mutase family protein [Sandaracinobacteroides saxicola]|uniref:Isocitrate lyase/PEP mutase family protein n=1 Tax=Sandaracinobacteroides saxicola TaxID=2759707 RepID=A0A7G5IKE7_9SPHN|nr:isocitrate lyase/PEP mutase family protein [Sandaracinobacteroides saxicola]QMW23839.1 isocitrate lyase/PEP mutase family protein [Sandaracinobacteroides saxicola]
MTHFPTLFDGRPLVAPGVHDALSAVQAEAAGFRALFVGGSGIAFSRLARPDVGLLTLPEMADAIARIADRVGTPLIADADSGFGNAAHVARTARAYARAGAAVMQLEDQAPLKPVDALASRPLVSVADMVGRIRAAKDAASILVSARTDAPATRPFAETLDRAHAYVEAGADLLFVEGLSDAAELAHLAKTFGPRLPLVHNLMEGGRSPFATVPEAHAAGFTLLLFPATLIRAHVAANAAALAALADGRAPAITADVAATIGAPAWLAAMARYA